MRSEAPTPRDLAAAVVGVAGSIALTLVVATRAVPAKEFDRGVFVSVAERLRAGDRLYAEVWDNKDPVFFYALALGRGMGPVGDVIVELAWLALAVASAYLVARALRVRPRVAALIAAGAALLVTGGLYQPGATHLPGVALTLAALAASLSGRLWLTGAALATLLLTKLVMLPIALALVVLVAWQDRWSARRWVAALAGAIAAAATGFAVLALRGELAGFLETQRLNVEYASAPVLIGSSYPPVDHLLRGLGWVGFVVLLLMLLVLLGSAWVERRWGPPEDVIVGRPRALAATALVAALVVLAMTGMWSHHSQALYVAGVLCLLLVGVHLEASRWPPIGSALAMVSAAVVLSGSLIAPPGWSPRERWEALFEPSPESVAMLALDPPGPYARLGMHDDHGHAEGLARWSLACPRFHLYPWDRAEVLTAALGCAEAVDTLIVSDSIETKQGRSQSWNDFARQALSVVDAEYSCQPFPGGRLCRRR